MVYQFNNILGRVTPTTNVTSPLFPVSPLQLEKREIPKVTYDPSYKLSTVTQAQVLRKAASTSPDGIQYGPMPEKLKRLQEHFQKPNDIPVWLKGGPKDKVLFGITCALIVVGFGMAVPFVHKGITRK